MVSRFSTECDHASFLSTINTTVSLAKKISAIRQCIRYNYNVGERLSESGLGNPLDWKLSFIESPKYFIKPHLGCRNTIKNL